MHDRETESSPEGRFDVLLRDLLGFGLVQPCPEPHGATWQLSPLAQRRLDELGSPPPPVDKVVYFGHRCSICHEHVPTRRRAGSFVCDACTRPDDAGTVASKERHAQERSPLRSA